MKFKTTLLTAGKTATGIKVPDKIIEGLNAGKKPAVVVNVNGYTYRTTVAVMGGAFMIPVSADHRGKAGLTGGDKIEVELILDAEPRIIEIPDELKKALKAKGALNTFEALATSKRKEFVRQVNDAKTKETRDRRIATIVFSMENN